MSKPMTVARYAKEHRGWFYGCLLLFALVAFFCLKAIYDMTVYGAKAPLSALPEAPPPAQSGAQQCHTAR